MGRNKLISTLMVIDSKILDDLSVPAKAAYGNGFKK